MSHDARVTFAGADGSPAAWTLSSLRSSSAAEALALFSELGVAAGPEALKTPPSGFDSALIFAARLHDGARGAAALSSRLKPDARCSIATALDAWATTAGAALPAPTNPHEAMAFIEKFKGGGGAAAIGADAFEPRPPTALKELVRARRPRARKLLKEFRTADISLFCPRGDTTMLALLLQALGGLLPCDGEGWSKADSTRCLAVLQAVRVHAADSAIGPCLRHVEGMLYERALLLSAARAEGALEEMLRAPIGVAGDTPCSRFLPRALARLPALASAISARPVEAGEPLCSVVALLSAHGFSGAGSAVTIPNLVSLNVKIAANSGGTAGDTLYSRALRIGAAASQTGGSSGESRQKHNSADFELHAATLGGVDDEADIRALLLTRLSVVRKGLAGAHVPLAHAVTARAAALSTAMPRYTARSIIASGACDLSVPATATLPPALTRSLLDGTALASIGALCKPLVALHGDPIAGFKALADIKGPLMTAHIRDLLPSEMVRQLHKAYANLFADLGYLAFGEFCASLVDLTGLSSRCSRLLDGKVAEFAQACLSHVSDLVKNHFSATANDDKLNVSFMPGAAHEILAAATAAANAYVSHVDMGLIPRNAATSAPSADATKKKKTQPSTASDAPAAKRSRDKDPALPPSRGALAVAVDGDVVRTKIFEYSRKKIEETVGRPLNEICLPGVLGGRGSCPTPDEPGHEKDGRLHDRNGKDLRVLGTRRADAPAARVDKRPGFGRPAEK
jgi:hypothetical protein